MHSLSRKNRLVAAYLGNVNVIAGQFSVDRDDDAEPAFYFVDSEDGGSPPPWLPPHFAIQSAGGAGC
ncbi:MAG TPA: hypothetical protein VG672_11750 [Bryobacteraceae bacterium]|jgi:hypothetical protein|nr:hypothetical protein [Bryobacteraceae bacterium]